MVIKQEVQLIIDQAAAKRIESRLEAIKKEQFELAKAFNRGETEVDGFKDALAKLDREAKQLNSTLDRLEQPRKLDVQTDRFDAVSRDVSLAGDVGSNAATIGSVIGGNAGAALGRAGEFAEVVEALPRLKEAVAGMPATISAAAEALGTSTLGFGAAALAVVGLGVALSELQKQAEETRQAVQDSFASLQSDVEIRQEAARLTDEEQRARQESARIDLENAKAVRDSFDSVGDTVGDTAFALNDLAAALGFNQIGFSTAQESIDSASDAVDEAQRAYDTWTSVIDENTNAAVDAAAAEAELARIRTQNVLTDAQQAGELASLRERVTSLTREQIDSELESLSLREASLRAELDVLRTSGDTSEQVASKIRQLTDTLEGLGNQASVLQSARATARSSEALKAAEKAENDRTKTLEAAARKQEQAVQQAAKAQQNYSDSLRDIAQKTNDAFKDLRIDTGNRLEDLRIGARDDDIKAEMDYQHDLAKLREDARKNERDAVRSRDFAAISQSREAASEAMQERLNEFQYEGQQRLLEIQNQGRDILTEEKRKGDALRREANRQRRNANQDLQDFYRDQNTIQNQAFRSSLTSAQRWASTFARTVQSAFNSAGGASASGAGGTSNIGGFEDALREIAMR